VLLNQAGKTMTDPIADLLTRIKNAYKARHETLVVPFSKIKLAICEVLINENYLKSANLQTQDNRQVLVIELLYKDKAAAISDVKRISKPGVRIYSKSINVPRVLGGLGISILSTPKGVMSSKQAKKLKLGGELICQVW